MKLDERIHVKEISQYSDDDLVLHGLFTPIDMLLKYTDNLSTEILEKVASLLVDHTPEIRFNCLTFFISRTNIK